MTTIINNTHIHGQNQTVIAAHIIAADQGINVLAAYCILKGIKVNMPAQKQAEIKTTIKTAAKVRTNKLRAIKKIHKPNKKAPKATRAKGAIFTNTSKVIKAKAMLERAIVRLATKLSITYREVLALSPQDILRGGHTDILSVFGTVKALMA